MEIENGLDLVAQLLFLFIIMKKVEDVIQTECKLLK